jgi:hypothetical protein
VTLFRRLNVLFFTRFFASLGQVVGWTVGFAIAYGLWTWLKP